MDSLSPDSSSTPNAAENDLNLVYKPVDVFFPSIPDQKPRYETQLPVITFLELALESIVNFRC